MKSLGDPAKNDSKGCGEGMRVALIGLFAWLGRQDAQQESLAIFWGRCMA